MKGKEIGDAGLMVMSLYMLVWVNQSHLSQSEDGGTPSVDVTQSLTVQRHKPIRTRI